MAAEINETDLQEMGRLVAESNDSGRLDSEGGNGTTKHISWALTMDVWGD
jgi:hypothetical protein